jgi:murein endopeptidase
MRSLAVVVVCLFALTATSQAHVRHKHRAVAARTTTPVASTRHAERHTEAPDVEDGQSIGVPWSGRLRDAARLEDGDGYVIRRPYRAFGTATTVSLVEQVITSIRAKFPDNHVLAIGDISAEHGGPITEHHSHQSGRDIDVGLFYNEKPRDYPASFVTATASNLDCEATFALLAAFVDTAHEDGGAQMIFLDYDVQGLLYNWAIDHDIDAGRLERMFQYPKGRGSSDGIVRHFPNHDNHMHVRFKCAAADGACH